MYIYLYFIETKQLRTINDNENVNYFFDSYVISKVPE